MYSLKLGAAWIVDAALNGSVPLRAAVVVPAHTQLSGVTRAVMNAAEEYYPLSTRTWNPGINRFDINGSHIYYFFSTRPDELRGRQFDSLWLAGAGYYNDFHRSDIERIIPSVLAASRIGPMDETLLATY